MQKKVNGNTILATKLALDRKAISEESHAAVLAGTLSLQEAKDLGRDAGPDGLTGPTPKTLSKDEKGQRCWCGCDSWTKPNRRWLPGHDQRAKGIITRAVREGKEDELSDRLREYAAERYLIRQTRQRVAEENRHRDEEEANKKPKK